jgi:hypothetical protein
VVSEERLATDFDGRGAGRMSKEATFSLRYTHSAPDQIEAGELIKVLSAFNSIVGKASRTFYGSGAVTSFRLTHVQPGSIDIQGFVEIFAVVQPAFHMFPSLSFGIEHIPQLIKAWLDLLKFLKGKPPQRVQTVADGNAVQIENNDGNVTIINGNVYNSFTLNNRSRRLKVGSADQEGRRRVGTGSRPGEDCYLHPR